MNTPCFAPINGTGSLLIGSWVGSMAYAAVVLQAITYYQNCRNDSFRLKALVSMALVLDTANLVGQYAYAYLLAVSAANDPTLFFSVNAIWPIVLITFTGPILMVFGNAFLIRRLYFLSKSLLLAGVLASLQVLTLGVALFNASKLITPQTSTEDVKLLTATLITALCLYVIIDTSIAVSMLWYLTKLRSPLRETRVMIRRLMRMILQSGTATTIISIATLIAFLAYPPLSVAPTAVTYLISHLYSLTLLFNLNVREQMRREGSTVTMTPNYNYTESRLRALSQLTEIDIGQLTQLTEIDITYLSQLAVAMTESEEGSRGTMPDIDPKPSDLQ